MRDYKVLLVGSSGSGKTTAISTISEIPVVNTDVFNTDHENLNKEMTTVGLDYGEITFPSLEGGKLRLYGTPGQLRFSFIWQTLALGSAGIVLLADNCHPDPLGTLKHYLGYFKALLSDANKAVLVGVVKTDLNPFPDQRVYQDALQEIGLNIPVMILDAREYNSVHTVFVTLAEQLRQVNNERAVK